MKILFIVPYFGKFNNYFQLFLNSCKKNSDYNWLIFTDDINKYDYPSNVEVIYITFEEMRKKIENKFKNVSINLNLKNPYKFCDLKPLYGYIFEEYLNGYDYWGHCDVDLIFGKINHFITEKMLKDNKKIGMLGHFSLYVNDKKINNLIVNDKRTKEVLESQFNCKFDEELNNSVNCIFLKNNINICEIDSFADIYVKSSNFKLTHYDSSTNSYSTEKNLLSFFIWNDGILEKYRKENNHYIKEEFLYIHLQKRKMKVKNKNYKIYKIIPNSFEDIEPCFFEKKFDQIKKKNFNLHYFVIRSKNLKSKIQKKIVGDKET